MVTQITAFAASDGTMFDNEMQALEHDAAVQLLKLSGAHGDGARIIRNALMANPVEYMQALAPLASAIMARTENQVEELPMEVDCANGR